MFSKYFDDLSAELAKSRKPVASKAAGKTAAAAKKTAGKEAAEKALAHDALKAALEKMVPTHLEVDALPVVDPSGYIPEGVDYIVYRRLFRDFSAMMGGAVPNELVYGAFFVVDSLTKATLLDVLNRVMNLKKLNLYNESGDPGQFIPAFVVAMDTTMSFPDIQAMIFDFYTSKSIDNSFELDIMAVVNKGVVVKDWREARTFKAIVTGKDTLKWFFVLLNEYLDVERGANFDLRNYVKDAVKYDEY